MNEIKITVNEQLQQLQMLMHRAEFSLSRRGHNPLRGQGRVLAILKLKPEMSQKELTYLLNMSKQSVAELIKKLEKENYITREASTEDKRMMTIKLTQKGIDAAEETDDISLENTKLLDCLNEEELLIFSEYLERIINQYLEQFPDQNFEQRRRMMGDFMAYYGQDDRHGHHNHRHHENCYEHHHAGHNRCNYDNPHFNKAEIRHHDRNAHYKNNGNSSHVKDDCFDKGESNNE